MLLIDAFKHFVNRRDTTSFRISHSFTHRLNRLLAFSLFAQHPQRLFENVVL